MRTTSNKNHIYIGKEAGKDIIEEIKGAKRAVKIVSPYLSPAYIQELIKLHKNGVDITLITCDKISQDSSGYSNFKVSDLIKTERVFDEKSRQRRKRGVYISLISALIFAAIFSFSFLVSFLLYPSVILLFMSIILFFYFFFMETCKITYGPLFRIKVFDSKTGDKPWSTELIHSKIFIIDENICFLGSVNFTYSGFKTHYETAIRIDDFGAIKDISEEVERLYNSKNLRTKDIEEWDG